jgi:DNA-binding NarL/FixJ family response regulator
LRLCEDYAFRLACNHDRSLAQSLNSPAAQPFRVVVSDDHPVFRDGLVRVVKAAFPGADVLEAGTFSETLTLAQQKQPDLFLLDLLFPGMEPKFAIPKLRGSCPNAHIAIVSMVEDQKTVDMMTQLGIDAYIAKSIAYDRMVAALRDVAAGKHVTAISDHPPLWSAALPRTGGPSDLTPRQRDVLALLMNGKSNKEIGRALAISPFTVRIHVSALLRQLRVDTRAQAAISARSMRLELEAID